MDAARARERLAAARVARLATVRPDGRPHVVPIVFALAGDTLLSAVDRKPKRSRDLARLANVAAHPEVAVLADHYEEDWSALWWVRADGHARVIDDPDDPTHRDAVARLRARYPQQEVVGAVLAVTVTRWSGWAAAG